MNLSKYTLESPKRNCIPCKEINSIYFYDGYRVTDYINCGIFLTSDIFNRPDLAQDKLAITYRPRFRVPIDVSNSLSLITNLGVSTNSSLPDFDHSRVWPAFGHTGGAHEYVYKCLEECGTHGLNTHGVVIEYPTGGLRNFFYGDSSRILIPPAAGTAIDQYLQSTYNFLSTIRGLEGIEDNRRESKRTVALKVTEDGIAVAYVSKMLDAINLSLSLGIKALGQYNVYNMWAYLWSDDYRRNQRVVYGPVCRSWLSKGNVTIFMSGTHRISFEKIGETLIRRLLEEYGINALVARGGLILP